MTKASATSAELDLGETTLDGGAPEMALAHAERVRQALALDPQADAVLVFRANALAGIALLELKRYSDAEARIVEAINCGVERVYSADHEAIATVCASLGRVYAVRGNNSDAWAYLNHARTLHERWLQARGGKADLSFRPRDYRHDGGPLPPPAYARCLVFLAVVAPDDAPPLFERAEEALDKQLSGGHDLDGCAGSQEAYRVAHLERARMLLARALRAKDIATQLVEQALQTLASLRTAFPDYVIPAELQAQFFMQATPDQLARLANRSPAG
jgi:hypothetical protein